MIRLILLFFSLSALAAPISLEQKWKETCRDYETDNFVDLPEDIYLLENFWAKLQSKLPSFTRTGVCAKNLFTERFNSLTALIKEHPDKENLFYRITLISLENAWTDMDATGCILPGPHCDPALMQLLSLKDPKQITLSFQKPFLNYVTSSRLQPIVEFAPMNCHGTAEFLAGSFLKSTVLTGIKDWNVTIKSPCLPAVKKKWQNTSLHTVESLNPKGGILINMKYAQCKETDCGVASEMIRSCESNTPQTFTLIEGMCVHCWTKKLETAGFHPVSSLDYDKLKAGCILTLNDHSITLLKRSGEMCYYFESTTSFGAPFFQVAHCIELSLRFPYHYCR